MQTKFWQGTNFWVALGMAVGSIWGLTSEDISPIISGVFGITGGLFAAREKIKSAVVDMDQKPEYLELRNGRRSGRCSGYPGWYRPENFRIGNGANW
mgnify:CR=1 FL=1